MMKGKFCVVPKIFRTCPVSLRVNNSYFFIIYQITIRKFFHIIYQSNKRGKTVWLKIIAII
ncbi:MAG: hypothetical protein METHSR3v1_1250005 [Methanothrix sp.]|nr:MAG: hypothetical protein METHSR3v1_1250005 [Methanothrix sp.]